jgi:hypothetical protein
VNGSPAKRFEDQKVRRGNTSLTLDSGIQNDSRIVTSVVAVEINNI